MKKNKKILIIAEAGVNHNGNLNYAKKLALNAKNAGADIIKFQTYNTSKLVTKDAKLAIYQKKNTNNVFSNQYNLLKKYELSKKKFINLKLFCDKIGIEFLSSPFDLESLDFLIKLKVKKIKIPSGEITNYQLLKEIKKSKKPVILSTGMSTVKEIQDAVEILGKKKLTLLHCNSSYPTPFKDVNLKSIIYLGKKFKLPIGYSDHTLGYEVSLAAATLGSAVIEKHFTLNKQYKGPDHLVSLDTKEFKNMITYIRNIEKSLGSKNKTVTKSERGNIKIVRKSLFAKNKISKGEIFTFNNLTAKRPGTGISPMKLKKIIGKKSKKDFEKDELIII